MLRRRAPLIVLLCGASGLITGLSAPGIGYWLFAWCALAPFFVALAMAKSWWQASWRGFIFGLAYNLVAMHWYLGLAPLDWLGFSNWQGLLLACAALTITSAHQALLFAAFGLLCHVMPLEASLVPRLGKAAKGPLVFSLPALWVIPLLWVIILNKLGNTHDYLGVPWSMIEYSQFKLPPLIQIADVVGGIGIGYMIVLTNVALAILVAKLLRIEQARSLLSKGSHVAAANVLAAVVLLLAVLCYGLQKMSERPLLASVSASILQPNVNIDMEKASHRYTVAELINRQLTMLAKAPPGLCVLTESSVPARLNDQPALKLLFSGVAASKSLDLIIGAIDDDASGNLYNAAFGVTAQGAVLSQVYHKRYLVPFGEYTPIASLPEWLRKLTNTPAGSGYTAGRVPLVFDLRYGKVSPLICFETISPELAAASVRAGGQLLANISDLAWFHESLIGQQMIACAVFRAIENRRYFLFAANTGPSAIITEKGQIIATSRQGRQAFLTGKVAFNSQVSFFTKWFVF